MKVRKLPHDLNDECRYALTPGNVYRVIDIEGDDLRIMNDGGEPCLYSPALFDIIDAAFPKEWVVSYGEDEEMYATYPEFNHPGFWEDYFDDVREAIVTAKMRFASIYFEE